MHVVEPWFFDSSTNLTDFISLQPTTVQKILRVVPNGAEKTLTAAYLYNCSGSLRQYAKYNERHLAPLKVACKPFLYLYVVLKCSRTSIYRRPRDWQNMFAVTTFR